MTYEHLLGRPNPTLRVRMVWRHGCFDRSVVFLEKFLGFLAHDDLQYSPRREHDQKLPGSSEPQLLTAFAEEVNQLLVHFVRVSPYDAVRPVLHHQ